MSILCRIIGHRRSHGLLWRRGGHWHGVCQRCGNELVRTGRGAWLATGGAGHDMEPRRKPVPTGAEQ